MRLEDLQDVLRRRPFRPFRLVVSSGFTFEVRHPALCVPGRRSVFVGTPAPGEVEPVYDRFTIVDLAHVTHIEPLEPPAAVAPGHPASG